MSTFVQISLSGLATGAIYALAAVPFFTGGLVITLALLMKMPVPGTP